MFRQFQVIPEHADFQRILWRESTNTPVREYRLNTVTYGLASAPHTASACLQTAAREGETSFPDAAQAILNDTFVDDIMSGRDSVAEAISLQQQVQALLSQAGLQLSKWSSNSTEFLNSIPDDLKEVKPINLNSDQSVKALGVQWDPLSDIILYTVGKEQSVQQPTKRKLLSELGKTFDPFGLIAPYTIRAKMFLQELWGLKLGWDDSLSPETVDKWLQFFCDRDIIRTIHIPRCVITEVCTYYELHGFCDASERAFGACIYLRSKCASGDYISRLITAKARVAPVLQESIPKLELCAADLCANLIIQVKQSINIMCNVFYWTDSAIVLHWLADFPARWKTFVGNRVSKIQRKVPYQNWRHVATVENPADICSRGASAEALKESKLWWCGPDWLQEGNLPTPLQPQLDESSNLQERRNQILISQVQVDVSFLTRYSNLQKLQRITALCYRFINNARKRRSSDESLSAVLTPSELKSALLVWIKIVQSTHFESELQQVQSGKLKKTNKLTSLNPFIDKEGVLRVGGRIRKANVPEEQRFPAILPKQSSLTELIIMDMHFKYLHAGYQLLWCNLQREFWIINPRDTIRAIIRRCVTCRRHRATTMQQQMGNLPTPRVNICRPFTNTGVDYAGPYILKVITGRSNKHMKAYFAIFVCMATKAVHLEAVKDLTMEAFLAALTRFMSRRGICANVYSDCGSNFLSADKELQEFWNSTSNQDAVSTAMSSKGIKFWFSAPTASHQNGLWESGVKAAKHHLRREIGSTVLTYDEFETILCQVESCLNSRPLCAMSNDPNNLRVLTPSHFLVGESLSSIPQPDLTELKQNRLSRWQQTTWIIQHFWNRWRNEYLSSLQQRQKWFKKHENLHLGDLVLTKDDNAPPLHWRMGRVINLHPGSDDLVRVVTLKTTTGEIKRPIHKLCLLLKSDE